MSPLALAPTATDLRDEIDEELLCTAVVRETHDVLSFALRSPTRARYRFHPGQHLTVTVEVAGTPMSRCYSISSSPARPDELMLTVKRVHDGPVSGWLHDHLRVGDRLAVSGPLGVFSTDDFPAAQHLFLSAGSGVTPVMSMLRALCDARGVFDNPLDVVFVHHARTPADLVFRDDLEALAAEHAGVRVVFVCEGDSDGERWTGHRGRLSLAALCQIAPDVAAREVFLCGPPAYMAAARGFLAEAGADPARCHEESFDLLLPDSPPVAADDGSGTTYAVELRRSGRTLSCEAGTSILMAAAREGLTLPSSCGEGVCGTCKTTLLSGTVAMDHAGGIRPREIADDKILLCCSTPLGDVAIDA